MVLLGLVLVVAGYIAWYRLSDHEQTATHTVPAVPEQLLAAPKAAPVSPQVASVLPPPGAAPSLPAQAPASAPEKPPATAAQTPPAATTSPAPPTQTAQATQTATAAVTPAPMPAATLPPPATPAPPPATETGLVLHATAITWVQIRASSGRVTWDHVMQPGDTWPVPADQPDLTLTTGNAGGLEVSDNGVTLGGFGRGGAVRHNIPLTEAGVKAAITGKPAVARDTMPAAAPAASHIRLPWPDGTGHNACSRCGPPRPSPKANARRHRPLRRRPQRPPTRPPRPALGREPPGD